MYLLKVISGGQTGADRGALKAAKAVGLETGGWMPHAFRALDGYHPDFATLYGCRAHPSRQYPPRTFANVSDADVTVRFAVDFNSPGERCTMKAVRKCCRPYFDVDVNSEPSPKELAHWIHGTRAKVLNVAGNSERTAPGMESFVEAFLRQVFAILREMPDDA